MAEKRILDHIGSLILPMLPGAGAAALFQVYRPIFWAEFLLLTILARGRVWFFVAALVLLWTADFLFIFSQINLSSSYGDVLEFGRNDLEPAARMLAPVIGDVLQALAAQPGAIRPRMSGSGATCFALFGSAAERDRAAHAIAAARPPGEQHRADERLQQQRIAADIPAGLQADAGVDLPHRRDRGHVGLIELGA